MPEKKRRENFPAQGKIFDKLNKHLLMGYLFLALVFLGAVSAVYYWEDKNKASGSQQSSIQKEVGSGEKSNQTTSGTVCAQVITMARQKQTGEIREFPSECHVVTEYWEVVR